MSFAAIKRFFVLLAKTCFWAAGLWSAYFGWNLIEGGLEIGRGSKDWFAGISFIAAGAALAASAVFIISRTRKF